MYLGCAGAVIVSGSVAVGLAQAVVGIIILNGAVLGMRSDLISPNCVACCGRD